MVTRDMSPAERLEQVIGYMNRLGYVYCLECATKGERELGTEMRSHNLASLDDECDNCHRRLVQ